MGLVLLIVLLLVLASTVPAYPYSRDWGYRPAGMVSVLLIVLLILLFMQTIPWGFAPYGPAPVVP